MVKTAELKTFTKEEVEKMVKDQNKAIVIFEGEVFDATNFKETHPGGPKYIDDNVGKDISQLFYDNDHSKIALRLLKEIKIGTLASSENSKSNSKDSAKMSRMKEIEDEAWRELHLNFYLIHYYLFLIK